MLNIYILRFKSTYFCFSFDFDKTSVESVWLNAVVALCYDMKLKSREKVSSLRHKMLITFEMKLFLFLLYEMDAASKITFYRGRHLYN